MESLLGQTLDSYKILEIVGRGGMGVVFKALDTNLDKIVALKMIDPILAKDDSFVRRFKTEARALAKLDNPNIVGVYALRETGPYFFMVMEYIEANPLSQYIRENGKLKLKDVLKISKQLLNAVSFAHKASIIHRDIKPSNILLYENGLIKVTDFGLAKLIKSHDSGATVTQARAGTLYYMSPEQVKGLKNVDRRGDIYSVGMTIYEMTVGRVPFDKTDSDFTIQRKIVDGEIPSPVTFCKDVPKKLIKIILKSIAKDPDKRYQSADEMVEDIQEFEKDLLEDEKTVVISCKDEKEKKSLFRKPGVIIPAIIFLVGVVLVYILLILPENNVTKRAFISLSTHPPDAIIKVNDEVVENSQLDKIEFDKEEDIKLQISKSGFQSIDTLIRTVFDRTKYLAFNLIPISKPVTTGKLTLTTKPSKANIYINRDPVGESPLKSYTTVSGKVNLSIEKTGYNQIDTSINIIEEKENSYSFTLNKITEFGGLKITSDPSKAEVWLNWKKIGITPFDKPELPVGTHQLIIRKNGFADYKQSVKITADKITVIPTIKLNQFGKLTVTAEPADAEIIIDNNPVGKGNYTSDKMKIGEHNITVRKNGFKSYTEKINIEVNKAKDISAKLIALIAKVEILVRPYGNIFIDDKLKKEGTSSLFTANITGGSHKLKVVHPTLGEWIKNIEIKDEVPRKYIIDFTRTMKVTIISNAENAEIYINGKLTEYTTPKVLELKAGTYLIQVKQKDFYDSDVKKFTIDYESGKDQDNKISFELKKIE